MEKNQENVNASPANDSNAVLTMLSHLPLLSDMAASLAQLVQMGSLQVQLRHLEPSISPGMDYVIRFAAESIYIDNLTNSGAITIQFDNEPLQFKIVANGSIFLPCMGAKQYRINGAIASGSVNVMTINRPMSYN